MNRCFILLDGEKVIDITLGWYDDNQATELTAQGYVEIFEFEDVNILTPYLYKKGKLVVNDAEIQQRTADGKIREEYDLMQSNLASTDYVVIKIAEGVATEKDYADVLKDRAEWRKRINELEKEIG